VNGSFARGEGASGWNKARSRTITDEYRAVDWDRSISS
jgi:hypothetical protein